MKSRFTLIFATLVILLGTMIWLVSDRRSGSAAAAPVAERVIIHEVDTAAAPSIAASIPVATEQVVAPVPEVKVAPMVHVDAAGLKQYVARDGDTVSQLAVALMGSDSKANRDAVIAANPTLQADPDKVLTGYAYSMGTSQSETKVSSDAKPTTAVPSATAVPDAAPAVASGPKLRYTAQPGDTVGGLAAGLLGADTEANRSAIIARNASLRADPDHLVAGKSYTIVAANGLAAAPDAHAMKAPTSQPDADDAAKLSVGRTLRYTAQPGDTVSSLAVALLGSDTPANRELITKSNPSLKENIDHLVAGQSYWIAAPTADAAQ